MNKKAILFSTRKSLHLSKEIAHYYGDILGKINFLEFSDGEYEPSFEQSVRGASVFLIGSTMPPADNLMELLLMCDAAKRASARNITLVIPYFGWGRQDRKEKNRAPIGAKLVSNLITASGATRVITMDLHADQIQGFFEIPLENLYASTLFIEYIKQLKLDCLTIASPDMGGVKRARSYAGYLNADVVICYKERKKANNIDLMNIIGNVKNKNVIIVDDLVDTADTILIASNLMKEQGAKSIRAIATHPILSGYAYEKIENSSLQELVVTNTIKLNYKKFSKKITILNCAKLFAQVMHKNSKI
ncbi:MAG: ribose-phosphate pyrophosphokinase [Candidatus Sulcia muelleri]|uniref:ribose-phosphate diphosphokinase n=3 Tax=cellular organisms TaxID=131567 RepID=A8Z5Q7_KARMG|nr:ribose-phosphate pyrophosphokinase [Candidatus Karelsulcia muelleri GWSS]AIN47599.1 Ribose-phosphate pyrophosphokinase [Candidatus Karelsulcia muelleri]EAT14063.1 ribose-phosphate pyrophosphokinase [Candidatus Karelsulcia muelleri str. Hc (Homalodisca coagulata)]MBS0018838.1 ribose-phosphate pyrophosphokinase [Candidatus Karelsulcia muelleri]MCJ7422601.1 ribose-phosphate pyrophosphokinase [Candidatus Karelsulcia muelleri]